MIGESVSKMILPSSITWRAATGGTMPLVQHLREGYQSSKPAGWHRNEERQSQGFPPVKNLATQLEGWERELVWMEILLLTGNCETTFRHLAHGWGRDKGFHMVLAHFICRRHGNVERKKRDRFASIHKANNKRQKKLPASKQEQSTLPEVWESNQSNNYNNIVVADTLDFEPLSHSKTESDEEEFSFSGFDFESWDENSRTDEANSQFGSESSTNGQVHRYESSRTSSREKGAVDHTSTVVHSSLHSHFFRTDPHAVNSKPIAEHSFSQASDSEPINRTCLDSVSNGYSYNRSTEVDYVDSSQVQWNETHIFHGQNSLLFQNNSDFNIMDN